MDPPKQRITLAGDVARIARVMAAMKYAKQSCRLSVSDEKTDE
jgi:hypothetical protein